MIKGWPGTFLKDTLCTSFWLLFNTKYGMFQNIYISKSLMTKLTWTEFSVRPVMAMAKLWTDSQKASNCPCLALLVIPVMASPRVYNTIYIHFV